MASEKFQIDISQSPYFMEYPKISEDSTEWNSKELNKIKKWIVLEKIHGANFSFYISNTGAIQLAKRNSFLSPNDYFFGIRNTNIIPEINDKLLNIYRHICCKYSDILQLSLHGELFGGKINYNFF